MQSPPFPAIVQHLTGDRTPRVWSFLISVFGDLAQAPDARISAALLRQISAQIGIRPEAMRVALHRLRKDGWIDSARAGRTSAYFLTDRGRAQSTAASPRIYGTGPGAETAWLAAFNPGQPGAHQDEAGVWLSATLLVSATRPATADAFVTPLGPGTALPDWMTARICDATTVQMAADFARALAGLRPLLDSAPGLTTLETTALRVLLVHGWRRIVLRTPILPDHLFPATWQGPVCRAGVADLLARYPKRPLAELEAARTALPCG